MANSLQLDFDRLNIDGISTAAGEKEDSKTVSSLGPGDVVSVKYRGKEWRRATIVQVRDEGSFDVTFENGETEKGVPPSMLRMRDSPKHINKASPAFDLTVDIEAAVTPRGSKSTDVQNLKSRQDLVAYIYRLQATIEEQAETIRLQEISIAALKRQTVSSGAQV
eukprot:INCI16194.2.p1 GENE.INCI16194.2~~INCI16194.2.p1  ORF type:complete len:165 (+),score=30.32 INCI16194.2:504-998(+)